MKVIIGLNFQRMNRSLSGRQQTTQLELQYNMLGAGSHSWHFTCYNSPTPHNSLSGGCSSHHHHLHFPNEETEAQSDPVSGRAGVQAQAGCAFLGMPCERSGRAGGHCSTEVRSGVVLDHADYNRGLSGSLLLSCRHSFLREVLLTHALHPRCYRGAAGTRVTPLHLQCAFRLGKLGESSSLSAAGAPGQETLSPGWTFHRCCMWRKMGNAACFQA